MMYLNKYAYDMLILMHWQARTLGKLNHKL